MKNIFKIFSLIFILFLVGCKKEEIIICNIEVNNDVQNYNMVGTYKIYHNDNYVTNIEKEEKYKSDNIDMIDYFYESKKLEYSNLNDIYGGITYEVSNTDNSVDLNIVIDTKNLDIKKMVKNNYIDKDYVISNKLTTSGLIKIYESKGAICNI